MKLFIRILFAFLSTTAALAQKPSGEIIPDCNQIDHQATVILYRRFNLLGSGLRFDLYHDDSLLTRIGNRSFYVAQLPLGKNTIFAQTTTLNFLKKNKSSLDLNLKAGQTYFVICKAKSFSEGITKPKYRLLFKVLSDKEIKRNIKKGFLKRRLKKQLYNDIVNRYR